MQRLALVVLPVLVHYYLPLADGEQTIIVATVAATVATALAAPKLRQSVALAPVTGIQQIMRRLRAAAQASLVVPGHKIEIRRLHRTMDRHGVPVHRALEQMMEALDALAPSARA
jgi:sensor histidine kinase regulating citrate/malate metabolism